MRRYALLALVLFNFVVAFAQQIEVKSFRPLPTDMTASSLENKRIDQNGAAAALIKIVTSQTGFAFDGGTLGIVDSKQMVGEIWVWVPYGSRKITITHQQLGVLREYRYPIEIEAERTYEMVLVTGSVETVVKPTVTQQYLAFQITPPNATLEVDDKLWTLSADGSAMKFVNFGTYTYRVQAKGYHPDAGKVTVDNPNETQRVTIALRPNFGWIEVPATGNLRGANVYVDNELVGQAPCKSGALVSGSHVVRIAKEMYEPYSESVEVSDNETTRFAPNLRADYAEVTLKVDADAEIWVNDQKKGVRSWKGALANGTYKIECKQKGHESSLTTKEITTDMQGQTITLESPRPIYGSLSVESTPFATIYIDGKSVGDTPRFISEILVGNHELRLVKSGYVDHVETISVGKGERKDVKVDLAVVKQPEKPAAPQSDPPSTKPGKVEASNTSIVPDIIEGIGPNASCEELNRVLSAKMAANPNDATLLKRILITLDYRGCTDSRLFIEAVINLYSLDPCPEASYGLGVKALNERKYTDASKFFDQATRNGGNYIKYRAFCNLAICSQQVGNFSRARDLAKQAAQVNPTAGEPYLIMAQLYAESTKQFNGEIESKAVYWAAVDKCNQAKSIDASAAERANSMIRIYSAAFPTMETIFFNDYSEGQRYHVGGWIDENTTIRARK